MTEHAFLEPECSVARPLADGRMEIYVGSQIPYADREQVAASLGVPQETVRVIGQLIGGGFGGKEDIAGQIHAALLAHATGRPVKMLYDRNESLLVHPKRHATQIRVTLGATRDGTLLAAQTELYGDTGAYASLGDKVMTRATTHSAGPYVVPHVRADCYAMYTNNPPAGAFRGFGVTQSCFAIESVMDELAAELGLDPIELRRRNALNVGMETNTGQRLTESVGLLECIDRVEAEIRRRVDGNPFVARTVPGAPSRRRAWGFAVGYKNTGLGGGAPDKAGARGRAVRGRLASGPHRLGRDRTGAGDRAADDRRRGDGRPPRAGARPALGHRPDPGRRTDDGLAADVCHRERRAARHAHAAPGGGGDRRGAF